MSSTDWQKIRDIFSEVLERPEESREAALREICGDDPLLFAEVSSLLAAHEVTENIIEKNALKLEENLIASGKSYEGKAFGHYRIVREIGRGGMGAVFLATRTDGAFQQQVALKIVRQTIADTETERRFRREREILAALNHPNIAILHDGGVSDAGEPFLAMELIDGKPLLEFTENLNIRERLRLFLKICSAVDYAHRNLTIHRDIKPSNILVTKEGEPKLLDFGLAKILDENLSDAAKTQTAFRAFTPAYASPEQILGKNVTTTADVYSLGIVFYELLTGEKPFHFEGKSLEEIIQTITKSEPLKPSQISGAGGDGNGIKQQSMDISRSVFQNPQSLRGDLDNIALKALQKEPERRYKSVSEFADDIDRHLRGLPILARPNTFAYRASKFIRRNKIAVSASALVILALAAGLAVSLWQAEAARREAAKAEAISHFLQNMLKTANPQSGLSGKKGYETTISDILKEAENRLQSPDLASQPEIRAELRQVVGVSYLAIGNYVEAERNLKQSLAEQTEIYGESSPKLLTTEFNLAALFLAKAEYENAENIYKNRFPLFRNEFLKGNVSADFFAERLADYAILRRARGDSAQAEKLLRENLEIAVKNSLETQIGLTKTLLTLVLLDLGKFDEAKSFQLVAAEKYRNSPNNETPEFCASLTLLGSILMEKGELEEADKNLREAEAVYRKLYSPNFTAIFDNLRLQAQGLYLAGKYQEAETKINQVLENYRQNSSPKYISFATALTVQGLILNRLGKPAEAETVLREALRLRAENLPEKHFMSALTKGALGEVLTGRRNFAEAEPLLLESFNDLTLSQAAENERVKLAKRRLAEFYTASGRSDPAINYQ